MPQPTIEGLYETMKGAIMEAPYYQPKLVAIFFEANQDGIPRALTTYPERMDRMSCLWFAHYFKDGRWLPSPVRKYEEDGLTFIDPTSYLEVRPNEFYILKEQGQKPKFIAIHVRYNRVARKTIEMIITQEAYHITIDPEGYLKTIRMPEFEGEWEFEDDEYRLITFPIIKLKSPEDKLEPVEAQTFIPAEQPSPL